MNRNRAVSLLLVALFLWVTGCTSYTQIQLDEVIDNAKVRVTTIDGERETVHNPRLEADSIKGAYKGSRAQTGLHKPFRCNRWSSLKLSEQNTASTVLLVIGFAAVIFFGIAVAACNGSECG